MDKLKNNTNTEKNVELRRDVTVWGSFMWGFADVGANVCVALGLVIAATQGVAPLAFALAGIVYIMIGLAYTELASAYPVAGGGQYFALRGLGDFWGFVSGAALLLDYTIDIALFAVACAGYINFFFPYIQQFKITIGPFVNINPLWCLESVVLIGFLIWLNIRGVRESSFLNEMFGVIEILSESALIIMGFVFAWKPEFFIHQWAKEIPTMHNFMYGSSLAIISFVGLESISQAAQETRRPATIIPRTSITLIFSVFIFAIAFSTLGLGMLPWQTIAAHEGDPLAVLGTAIPYIGYIAGPFAAILSAIMLLISANTGVMGASRLTFCMSQFKLIPSWFNKIHQIFRTPARTIVIFSTVGILETVLAFLTPRAMDTLANMYAFGATLGYTLVFISLIKLRFSDPYTPRPYKMPLNIKIKYKKNTIEIPILGIIGMCGVAIILVEVILTHEIGRIAGPAWVLLCFIFYVWYRMKSGQPVFKSAKKDWESEQKEVLKSAEEFDLLEQYEYALLERDKTEGKKDEAK
ncbi:MAG: APC family permease [Candidatus Firestonebacteria bacterium]